MNSNKPALKHNQLIDEINSVRDNEIDDFTLSRFKREADKLITTDPSGGWVIKGIIATLESDVECTKKYFANAIRLSPSPSEVYLNYSTSLYNLTFLEEAIDNLKIAYSSNEGNLSILDALITYYADNGEYEEAKIFLEQWNREKPEENHKMQRCIDEIIDFIDRNNTPPKLCNRLLSLVYNLLHDNNVYKTLLSQSKKEDNESEWLSYTFALKCSKSKINELNMSLIDRVVEENLLSDSATLFTARFESA